MIMSPENGFRQLSSVPQPVSFDFPKNLQLHSGIRPLCSVGAKASYARQRVTTRPISGRFSAFFKTKNFSGPFFSEKKTFLFSKARRCRGGPRYGTTFGALGRVSGASAAGRRGTPDFLRFFAENDAASGLLHHWA
jgi:hypothetical protein